MPPSHKEPAQHSLSLVQEPWSDCQMQVLVVLMQMPLQHSGSSKQDSSLLRQSVQVLLTQVLVQHSEPSLQKLPFDRQLLHWPLTSQM
jgi:hypothetical protein